jgi:N-acetylglucosaminyldiphosphoundecaprenol N-acetyl-beta-D-mannosaminyltransferase
MKPFLDIARMAQTATDVSAPPGAELSPPPHAEFLGLRFCLLTQRQTIELLLARCAEPYRYVVTPNAHHVVTVHEKPTQLLPIYREAWLSLCDSRILRGLARWTGLDLPLVTGSDLTSELLASLNDTSAGRPPRQLLIVGPTHASTTALRATFPHAAFEVMPAPANLATDARLRLAVARACVARPWDILLLCVGCPAQELIARDIAELGRTRGVALCVGAAIDYLTGAHTRAPIWLQRLSLEWAYRLAREPGRLWRRYLVESPKVLRIFVTTLLAEEVGQ